MTTGGYEVLVGAHEANQLLQLGVYHPAHELAAMLARHGVQPVAADSRGNRKWSRDKVLDVKALIEREVQAGKPRPDPGPDLRTLFDQLPEQIAEAIGLNVQQTLDAAVDAALEEPAAVLGKVLNCCQAIVRQLGTVEEQVQALHRTAQLQDGQLTAILSRLADPPAPRASHPAPPPARMPAPPPAEPAPERKRVGIVGLVPPVSGQIEKEFGDCFRLTILGPNEPNRVAGLKHCDAVFCLSKYVGTRHLQDLHAMGQKPVILKGTGELREALTRFFVSGK